MVINLLAAHVTREIFLLIVTTFTTVVTEESKSAASKFGTHGAGVEERVMSKRLEELGRKRASVCMPVCAQACMCNCRDADVPSVQFKTARSGRNPACDLEALCSRSPAWGDVERGDEQRIQTPPQTPGSVLRYCSFPSKQGFLPTLPTCWKQPCVIQENRDAPVTWTYVYP